MNSIFRPSALPIDQLLTINEAAVAERTRSSHILPAQTSPWISVTELQSFCQNDFFSDWLVFLRTTYDPSFVKSSDDQTALLQSLFQKGKEHEQFVMNAIRERLGLSLPAYSSHATSRQYNDRDGLRDLARVRERMAAGDDVIYSAYLQDGDLRGIPDILVRNDRVSVLFPCQSYPISPGHSRFGDYYYLPIEIKFSSIHLATDGVHILNQDRVPYYKAQLSAYAHLLHAIQGVMPGQAFIIGKRTMLQETAFDPLFRPGFIDYVHHDEAYHFLRERGLKWLREVKKNGRIWSFETLRNRGCLPNMKVEHSSRQIQRDKQVIADSYGDITNLWQCGVRQRGEALSNDIHSYRDPRLTSQHLSVATAYRTAIDRILSVNRGESGDYFPQRVDQTCLKDSLNHEMYVDFETIRDSFEVGTHDISREWIFLIGVYYKDVYVSFHLTDLQSEQDLIEGFHRYWVEAGRPRCWYWHAEKAMWNRAVERCDPMRSADYEVEWVDLCEFLRNQAFAIRRCLNFKLKSIVYALRSMGYITIDPPPSTCESGVDAMITAWEYYQTNALPKSITQSKRMNDVIQYNRFDCMAIQQILIFLRNLE